MILRAGKTYTYEELPPYLQKTYPLVGLGLTNKEIAQELNLSYDSIRVYVSQMLASMDLTRTAVIANFQFAIALSTLLKLRAGILLLLLAALPLNAQPPGPATSIFAGKMTCSARLFTRTQVQYWCVKGTRVTRNTLSDITDADIVDAFVDRKAGEPLSEVTIQISDTPQGVKWEVTWQIGQTAASKSLSGFLIPGV